MNYEKFKNELSDAMGKIVNVYDRKGKLILDYVVPVEMPNEEMNPHYFVITYIFLDKGKEKYNSAILTNNSVSRIEVVGEY